jgi:hypothetical protein
VGRQAEALQGLLEDLARREALVVVLQPVPLGQVADLQPPPRDDLPLVRRVQPGEQLEQARLAGPVGADEPYPLPFVEPERQPFEQGSDAESLGEVLTAEEDGQRRPRAPVAGA